MNSHSFYPSPSSSTSRSRYLYSGKTYTVTGTPAEPGILPRSLDLIFNTVTPQQMSSLDLLPKNFSEAIYLSEEEAESQRIKREAIWNKV